MKPFDTSPAVYPKNGVRAIQIMRLQMVTDDQGNATGALVVPVEDTDAVSIGREFLERKKPEPGDFLLLYPCGTLGVMKPDAFEAAFGGPVTGETEGLRAITLPLSGVHVDRAENGYIVSASYEQQGGRHYRSRRHIVPSAKTLTEAVADIPEEATFTLDEPVFGSASGLAAR